MIVPERKGNTIMRVTAFLAIFLILFAVMTGVFSNHPDFRAYQGIACFYKEPANSLQGVYIGSSSVYAFWNPLVAWENHGLAVYPFSCGAQPFYATEYLIREARKTQPDALMIVNINAVEADDLDSGAIHNLVSYMPKSANKTALVKHLADKLGYSRLERLEFYMPWLKVREHWLNILEKGLIPKSDGMKGASRYGGYLAEYIDITDTYIHSDERIDLSEGYIECINSLLDYCDAENVKVLFVSVPRSEDNLEGRGRINTACDMIEARGYDVLKLEEAVDEIGLDLTQDYYDTMHTNIHGSIKYTDYLSHYLKQNYGMQDLRGNDQYASWDKGWEVYAKGVSPGILDIELDVAHRDFTLNAPEITGVQKTENTAAEIKWSKAEGADSYLIYRKDGYLSPWTRIAEVEGTAASYLDEDCAAGEEYYYTVVPVRNESGEAYCGNFDYKGVCIEL